MYISDLPPQRGTASHHRKRSLDPGAHPGGLEPVYFQSWSSLLFSGVQLLLVVRFLEWVVLRLRSPSCECVFSRAGIRARIPQLFGIRVMYRNIYGAEDINDRRVVSKSVSLRSSLLPICLAVHSLDRFALSSSSLASAQPAVKRTPQLSTYMHYPRTKRDQSDGCSPITRRAVHSIPKAQHCP